MKSPPRQYNRKCQTPPSLNALLSSHSAPANKGQWLCFRAEATGCGGGGGGRLSLDVATVPLLHPISSHAHCLCPYAAHRRCPDFPFVFGISGRFSPFLSHACLSFSHTLESCACTPEGSEWEQLGTLTQPMASYFFPAVPVLRP